MKKIFISIIIFMLTLFLCSCKDDKTVISGFSMDAPYSIKMSVADKNKEKEMRELLEKCDYLFDAYDESSALGSLNKNKEIYINNDNKFLYDIIEKTYPYCNDYFDISIRNLSKLWDFNAQSPKVPEKEEIDEGLKTVGYENIVLKEEKIELKNDTAIELGAVAKGYAADKLFSLLNENEAVIDIGGTVISSVQNKIKVGIKNPDGEGMLCSFYLDFGEAVSTSGSYERYFIKDGVKYSNIINPKTGMSVPDELLCVTVITKSGLISDILSTSFFSSGLKGINFAESYTQSGLKAIFVTKDKKVYIKGNIEISDLDTNYKMQ